MEGIDRNMDTPSPEPLLVPDVVPDAPVLLPFIPRERDNNEEEEAREIPHEIFNNELPNPPIGRNNEEILDFVSGHQLRRRRHFLENDLRPEDLAPGGFFNPVPEVAYRPLSPQNSDEDADAARQVEERIHAARIIENMNVYLDPERIRQQALRELEAARARDREEEINNNGNFRNNNNGYLSPSPSPSPPGSPGMMDDLEPLGEARPDDMDIDLLMEQLVEMQPPRRRKRQNTDTVEEVKRKRVTFKKESTDEQSNQQNNDDSCARPQPAVSRRGFDDDDEGFFGGPPNNQTQPAA